MGNITEKQKKVIVSLENELGIKFTGKTKRDAWEWMQEYIPKYRQLLMDMVEQFKKKQGLSAGGSILRFDSYSNPTLDVLDHIDYMDSIPTKTIDSLNQEVNYYMSLMERW